MEQALTDKKSAFSPDLRRALIEDSRAQARAKGEIVGLDFDPFLHTQDPHEHYVVGRIIAKDDRCWIEVDGASSGMKSPQPDVVPALMIKEGRWLFLNFHYGKSDASEDENLLSTLKALDSYRKLLK